MTSLGPHLTVFLREYLPSQREMSVQTSDTYAYAFQLLVCFAAERLKITPSELSVEQIDATLVLAFLEHLEKQRENCARTRNSRLAAIKTFFKFLEYRLPSCLEQARRVRAIPVKKTDEVIVGYLNREEIQALLDAPDPSFRDGLRDRAMLHLAYAGGLRVSELVGLHLADLTLHVQPTIHVMGKGRRERSKRPARTVWTVGQNFVKLKCRYVSTFPVCGHIRRRGVALNQAARVAAAAAGKVTFQGRSSAIRLTGWSAMHEITWRR
jgi:integrase/recombinase XerD